jgi:glycosyltransferase involved in cell wall biosynthesis
MKIFVVPSWYPFPTKPVNGTFFKDHAEQLAKAGHEVVVVATEIISLKEYFNVRKDLGTRVFTENNVKTYQQLVINKHPKKPEAFYARYQKLLKTQLDEVLKKEGKPDLFHAHSSLWAGAALVSYDLGIPIIVSEHLKEFLVFQGFSDFQQKLIQGTYNKIRGLIAPSTQVMNRIQQYFRIPDTCTTHVVPNMVDTDYFKPLDEKPFVNRFTYLIVAMLRPEKRIDKIIEAFVSIGNTHLAKIRIVGDGPEYQKLKDAAVAHSLTRQVEFIRQTGKDVVLKNLQKADVCMLCSKMETFGVSLIEALSCGVPVIGGNIGGATDIITKKNGILVPIDNPIALSEAMKEMIEHPEKYDRKEIREDAIKRFDVKVVIGKLEEIYKSLL